MKEFEYTPPNLEVTDEMKKAYDENGFIIVRKLLDSEEVAKVQKALEDYGMVEKHGYQVPDSKGRSPKILLWTHPGDDVTGMVPRSEKVAGTCEQLMGGDEMYHYHTKIMMKDAGEGGSFEWHQDYGYSLKERVDQIRGRYPHMYINLQPGDALFFHCNLLHGSAPNDSKQRRWAFNCSFNKRSNNPVKKHHHPFYTKLDKVSNNAIKECEKFLDYDAKLFVDPETDETVHSK